MDPFYSYIFLGMIFLVTAAAVWSLSRLLFRRGVSAARLAGAERTAQAGIGWASRIAALMEPAARLTLPKERMKSRVHGVLVNAGYRGEYAPIVYFGAKTILAVLLPLVAFFMAITLALEPGRTTSLLILTAAIGYFAPNIFLIWRVRGRKREIFNAFPEALDLMVVCVEAGLALDAAIAKVGAEIGQSSAALGEEFKLLNLEFRAGSSREMALRNLALRTGVEDIDALVATLVQSEKFGTTIADSLRVYADSMRTKRMLRAEEAAQKLPIKLVFPVVLLIFPALFVVLLGPSILTLVKLLGPIVK